MTRGIINRDWARRVAHDEGVQLADDAWTVLDKSAESLVLDGVARAKSIGRKRVDAKLLRGLDDGQA